jgi:chorismate mutase/prephenate dehydratase
MSNRKKVDQLREQMAAADKEVLRILETRAKLAREVGSLTKDEPSSPHVLDRAHLDGLLEQATGDLPRDSAKQIFKTIHAACASLEGPARVAFVGAEGALGHVATRQVFGAGVQALACESPAAALDELSRGRVDFAIVPYETSHEGPVLSTILALKQTDLVVSGLCELAAGVALLSRTGNQADVEKVYATAHDHAHCEAFLQSRIPRASIIDVRSPSVACQFAAEDHGGAAIAHEQMGDVHGLSVVIGNIGDQHDLRMRYAMVGTRPSPRSGKDVTSMVFTLNNEPGALLAVLNDFAKRGINVKNIMSRPVPGEVWDYIFYIDVLGHATDRSLVAALDEIRKHTKFFKVIGSFPTHC